MQTLPEHQLSSVRLVLPFWLAVKYRILTHEIRILQLRWIPELQTSWLYLFLVINEEFVLAKQDRGYVPQEGILGTKVQNCSGYFEWAFSRRSWRCSRKHTEPTISVATVRGYEFSLTILNPVSLFSCAVHFWEDLKARE